MMLQRFFLASFMLAACFSCALAQDGIMGSAETINQGNFKLMAYPVMILDGDSELGVGLRAGYGFSKALDIEVKAVFFDNVRYLGADAEFWLVKGGQDISVSAGFHWITTDTSFGDFNTPGLDFNVLASMPVGDKLEVYGGLDVALEFPEEPFDSFNRVHLAPGLEYSLTSDIDLMLEAALGLNDDAFDSINFGVAYYLR